MQGLGKANINVSEIYRINDVYKILVYLVIIGLVGYFTYVLSDEHSNNWLIIGGLVEFLFLMRLRAYAGGYVVNFDEGVFTFPGGGIIPNSFWGLFNPGFVFQYFARFTIPYDQIRQISAGRNIIFNYNDMRYYSHWIKLTAHLVRLNYHLEVKVSATSCIQLS